VDGSRASSTGGTGLGLAIAREIVIRHGGTIDITSQSASGTRVIVTLPLAHLASELR
jgi:signal transduction histidine kinase